MKRILTGDRPTGPLHIGHYFGSLASRVAMQKDYETYILIADVQAMTDNFNTPEKVRDNVMEITYDYLASGLDPSCTTFVLQSKITAIAELTVFFSNLVTIARLARNPTVKEEIKQKKELFGDSVTYGFFGYPVSQAADILAFNADIVPVGDDQLPMIEMTREVARRFNTIYGDLFREPEAVLPKNGEMARIKGLDGNAKMGKSLNNAIYLKDKPDEMAKKVMSAYTDPLKVRKDDPGHPEGCMVAYYHKLFNEQNLQTVVKECSSGARGCVQCKKELIGAIEAFLGPVRAKREELERDPATALKIVADGTKKAIELTNDILHQAKMKMKIDYDFIFGGK